MKLEMMNSEGKVNTIFMIMILMMIMMAHSKQYIKLIIII